MAHTMDTDFSVELKINGNAITVDLSKAHESWLAHALTYGVRRFINDSHSGAKGQDKWEACMLMAKDIMSGEAMPEKATRSTGGSVDPVTALALKNVKADLSAMFKQVTGGTKVMDWAAHAKIAKFFQIKDDRATWLDGVVTAYMAKQAELGKVDYMKAAKDTLSTATDALDSIELDF